MRVKCPYCGSRKVYPLYDEIRLCCVYSHGEETVEDIGDEPLQELSWEFECKNCGKTFKLVWKLSGIRT